MAYPMGEPKREPLRVDFDRRLKLEFHGSDISSDAGLLPYRELDDALGLTELGGEVLSETRRGKNTRHLLVGLLRQSVFGRLAGYEDVNDAARLACDPVMRAIVDRKGLERSAASTSQMGRYETEWLATDDNLAALTELSSVWIDRVHERKPPKMIILDVDSSESPTWGEQEGSTYNGHFGCTCYHPLFLFNQFGDLERCALRPGNVHSADGWRDVLEPVVARYRERDLRRYFRGDAAFASPDIYEFLEDEGFLYAIRLPKNQVLLESICHLLTRPVGRPPEGGTPILCQFQLLGRKLEQKASCRGQSRMASWRIVSPRRIYRHQPVATGRAGDIVLQSAGQSGAIHQGRQERDQMDEAVVPQVPRQRRPAAASRPGLQSRQLHADAGFAKGGRALVADHAAGEIGEDRCQGGQPWPVRHVPIGRGGGAEGTVPENPEPD